MSNHAASMRARLSVAGGVSSKNRVATMSPHILATHISLRTLTHAFTAVAAFAIGSLGLPADAATIAPLTRIDVVPTVASSGVRRIITVNVVWPNGCPPDQAFVSPEPKDKPQVLLVRLPVPETSVVCPAVRTPISRQVTYTPRDAGVLPIIAVTGRDLTLVEGNLVTVGSGDYPNLSGFWMGTADDFAVLHITQSQETHGGMVGTMNLFGRDGSPRWRLIHSSRTIANNLFEAVASEMTGSAVTPCAGGACPTDGFVAGDSGIVTIEVQMEHQIIVTARASGANPALPAGTLLFRSRMYRFPM